MLKQPTDSLPRPVHDRIRVDDTFRLEGLGNALSMLFKLLNVESRTTQVGTTLDRLGQRIWIAIQWTQVTAGFASFCFANPTSGFFLVYSWQMVFFTSCLPRRF
jgi:hypothetical protein